MSNQTISPSNALNTITIKNAVQNDATLHEYSQGLAAFQAAFRKRTHALPASVAFTATTGNLVSHATVAAEHAYDRHADMARGLKVSGYLRQAHEEDGVEILRHPLFES